MKDKILVVEDESIVALDIKATLAKLGYEVLAVCPDGKSAVAMARELKPDLVLMDIRLSGAIDGIEAATQIKAQQSIPIVYLTAHADETTLQRAKITDPYGYVLKPFQAVELRVAIELALHQARQGGTTRGELFETRTNGAASLTEKQRQLLGQVAQLPALRALNSAHLGEFVTACVHRVYKAGDSIAFEGDARSSGFIVLRGRLALFKTSVSGRELIVELLQERDIFGLTLAIEQQPLSFSARAQLDSEVLLVPRSALLRLLQQHPELYPHLLTAINSRLVAAHDRARALAHDRVEARIARGLLSLIPDSSETTKEGFELHLTRKELAELCGTTVETAIRVTKNMERENILQLPENGVVKIVDAAALRGAASS